MLLDISDFYLKLECINICICHHFVFCALLWITPWKTQVSFIKKESTEKHFTLVLLQTQFFFFFFLHYSFKINLVFYSHCNLALD